MRNTEVPQHATIRYSRFAYAMALVLFCFLPFTEISCVKNGTVSETRKQTGLQAAFGGSTIVDASGNSRSQLSGPYGKPLMLVYSLVLLAGFSILILAPFRRDWSVAEAICSGVSLACLSTQYVFFSDYRDKLGIHRGGDYGDTVGRYTLSLYASFAAAVLLTVFAIMRCRSWNVEKSVSTTTERENAGTKADP